MARDSSPPPTILRTTTLMFPATIGKVLPPPPNPSSLPSAPKYKFVTALPADWTTQEVATLEEGLIRYAHEPNITKYIKIAAMLPVKTIRDVALRCCWTLGKESRRKPDDYYAGRNMSHLKNKMAASTSAANVPMLPPNSVFLFPLSLHHTSQNSLVPMEAVPGLDSATQHILEENNQLLGQIAANIKTLKANLAQERYKDMDRDKTKKRPFTMFHCWTLLQHNEKWVNKDYENPPKRTRTGSSSPVDEDDGGDEERERSPTPGSRGSMRPPGRKQEKDRLKKQAYGNGCKEAIQDMIETKRQLAIEKEARWMDIKAIEELKVANETERLRLKGEKALAKKKKDDQKIMFMDLSCLDDTQRAYVEAMRAKILAELVGTSGSGST